MTPFDPDDLDRRNVAIIERWLPRFRALAKHYFRLEVEGLEHIPRPPAMFVANHNGGICGPDLPCTIATLWEHLGPTAPLYALAHDFAMRHFLPLGRLLQAFGCLRASPHNVRRVLEAGGSVLVYPGGDLDAYRHYRRRNEIVFGSRSGFVRVAQRCGAPIVPLVAAGAHRSAIIFSEGRLIARALGLPAWGRLERFPIALALPWGIAIGPWTPYMPLPYPIRLRVLPPVTAPPHADPAAVREHVRAKMQRALHDMVGHT